MDAECKPGRQWTKPHQWYDCAECGCTVKVSNLNRTHRRVWCAKNGYTAVTVPRP